MKIKHLNMAITAGLLSATTFANVAYANVVSTEECRAANLEESGSCLAVSQWHESSDDFGGIRQSGYVDDLYYVVSKTGVYDKSLSYEVLPGYHWATFEEQKERLDAYRKLYHYSTISDRNYHNLAGWSNYNFNGIERRYFIYSNTAADPTVGKVLAVGDREYNNGVSSLTLNNDEYADAEQETVNKWAGFVLIKDTELPLPPVNFAPKVSLSVSQDGKPMSTVDAQGGTVTVTAAITDENDQDSHDISWSVSDISLIDLELDNSELTFEFDPAALAGAGTYGIIIKVNESNTTEAYDINLDTKIIVEDSFTVLASDVDRDGDGAFDADEGYSDSDGDGIPDYLDGESDTTLLPVGDGQSIQTTDGLKLRIGDVALSANGSNSDSAVVSVDDIANYGSKDGTSVENSNDSQYRALADILSFNISGLAGVGDSVAVVIPLPDGVKIPEAAVYRKYKAKTATEEDEWFTFVVDHLNSIKSADKDGDGNCPAPLDALYTNHLSINDDCIQLTIQDGGPNDADGVANTVVKDPGVLSIIKNIPPAIDVETSSTVNEESAVVIDASGTRDAEDDPIVFLWEQTSGTPVPVTLSGENGDILSFTAPSISVSETLTFKLIVSDGNNIPSVDVDVNVVAYNDAPTLTVEVKDSYQEGEIVQLKAMAEDVNNDAITYVWEQLSGPTITPLNDIDNQFGEQQLNFNAPLVDVDSSYSFQVTVSDGVETVTESVRVNVYARELKESSGGGSMSWILGLLAFGAFRRKLSS